MDASTQLPTKESVAPLLTGLLILQIIGLLPWAVFSALSGMGFDAGFNWTVVFVMAPFWAYPILMLICAPLAFSFNRKGRTTAASVTMLVPILVPLAWLGLLLTFEQFLFGR
jgi:hypothetical protein